MSLYISLCASALLRDGCRGPAGLLHKFFGRISDMLAGLFKRPSRITPV